MTLKNNIIKGALFAMVVSFSSCETTDLEQTKNPSQVGTELLDPVYAFNYVQLQLPQFVNSANNFTQQVTRQMAMTGGNTYDNAFAPVNFNGNWNLGYNMLNAIKIMEPKAIQNREYYALGASRVIRAYVIITMVDMYGDIPFSESLQGSGNLNPHYDNSASIYKQVLLDLDEAITTLQQQNAPGSKIQDLYYSDQNNWITLAKTLKLKMYTTARLAGADIGVTDVGAAIDAIVIGGDYILDKSKDFAFKYGNSRFSPNTRHPLYNEQYEQGGGPYIANYMMWAMTTEKGWTTDIQTTVGSTANTDPRTAFYFYKQAPNPQTYAGDTFTLPGRSRPDHYNDDTYKSFYNSTLTPYVISNWVGQTSIPANGFWGRDHGDNSGIPPDADKRTVGGIYPIGGTYGSAGSVQTNGDKGAQGAGVMPILLSSYVYFMLAEDAIAFPTTVGATVSARDQFEKGIRASIDKTINLIPNFPYRAGTAPNISVLQGQTDKYVDFQLAKYDVAATNKLELIIKEYFIAAWGNGIETYDNYRRTGYPSNFQPTLEPSSGVFFSTALYPGNSTVNNPNAPTNVRTKKVFWDKANLNLH